MVVNANTNSGAFYKEAINKLDDFEAFLPEEWPSAHSIFCLLPGVAEMVLPQLVAHFAAGTFGGVREDQVRIPRRPWKPEGATTSYRVYLEVDDDAFAWLKARNWQSYIGLYLVRWQHPPVSGITGYIAPDQDIEELLTALAEATQPEQTEEPMQVAEQETPQVTEQMDDERRRHPTGQSTEGGSGAKAPDTPEEEEEETLIGSELDHWKGKITRRQKLELLAITQPAQEEASGDPNNSVIHRELPTPKASSTPKGGKKKKEQKRRKRSRSNEEEEADTDSSSASSTTSAATGNASDRDLD